MVQPQLQLYVNTEADDPLAGILTGRGVTQEFHMVQEHSQEQQDTSHNYGCEICGWWDHLSPFPFPNCYWCGDRPSYHHGRCCPKLPKESSTENTDLDPSENPLFNMIFGKRDVETNEYCKSFMVNEKVDPLQDNCPWPATYKHQRDSATASSQDDRTPYICQTGLHLSLIHI